jgi:cell wall-associated NlpC family hydrolase
VTSPNTPNGGAASSTPKTDTGSLNSADPPGTSVFVYSPDIYCYIATENNGVIDVSPDIIAAQVKRVENQASQASVSLNNSKGHYSFNGKSIIQPMDKIIIYLSKIQTVKVFSGYVDTVPFLDLYPTTCDIQATCTLKRLLYTYWDPGLTGSQIILDQTQYMGGGTTATGAGGTNSTSNSQTTTAATGTPAAGAVSGTAPAATGTTGAATTNTAAGSGKVSDSGLGAMLANLLVKVGGWPQDQVKIQDFPTEFLKFSIATQTDPAAYATAVAQLQKMLGIDPSLYASASGDSGALLQGQYSGNIPQTPGNYGGVNLNATQLHYADAIAGTGKAMNMTKQAVMIALMTAMQESNLGLAGMTVAVDHDSLGLFQQRPSVGAWGSAQDCMDPTISSQHFFQALMKVPGWATMDPGAAAQAVQHSAFPGAYSKWQAMATALVNASSVGTSTPATPVSQGGTAPGSTVSNTTSGAGAPATGGTTQGAAPADKAIAFALAQVGKPYVWGAKGPDSFDCSGLTWASWHAAGKEIGSSTSTQIGAGTALPADNAATQPGDLWFPSQHVDSPGGHVCLVIGPNTVCEAPQPGQNVHVTAMYSPAYANRRIDPTPGQPKGANDATPGSGGTGAGGSGGSLPSFAYGLFNAMFMTDQFYDPDSDLLTGDRALINDQQLMQMVQAICSASLRNFQSSPDGDFVAYYPDYFGIHNNATVMALYDIEMINVKVTRSDLPMATHVFALGDTTNGNFGGQYSAGILVAELSTQGVVTIDDSDIFQMLLGIDPKTNTDFSASYIYKRYGARPLTKQYPSISFQSLERFQAILLFMTQWAKQYETQVEVTFMPDLFPGMRIQLAGHNLFVYVSAVTHNIDRAHGFTTTLTIMAPSTTSGGLAGLPISRSGVDTTTASTGKS